MFGGISLAIGKWAMESALMTSPAGPFIIGAGKLFKKIPWQVWAAIAAAILIYIGIQWHTHEIHKLRDESYKAGYAQAVKDIKAEEAQKTAEVVAITNDGDGQQEQVNQGVQKTYAQDVDSINATADRLRAAYQQRRPSSVAGPSVPAVSASTADAAAPVGGGRSEDDRLGAADPRPSDAGTGEPTIVVPALQLIDRAVICDTDHAQVKAWWKWYDDNEKIYQDWVAKVQKAAQPERMDIKATPSP